MQERPLDRMQLRTLVQLSDALDRGDLATLDGDREQEAAVDPLAVEQDRAGPTLAVIAALLGAGQTEPFAQRVEQRGAVVEIELVVDSVDGEPDVAVGGKLGQNESLRWGRGRTRDDSGLPESPSVTKQRTFAQRALRLRRPNPAPSDA
jgi:hypothetical protein